MADSFKCGECGRTFDSARGLHIHQSKTHGNKTDKTAIEDKEHKFNFMVFKELKPIGWLLLGVLIGSLAFLMLLDAGFIYQGSRPAADDSRAWENEIDSVNRPVEGIDNASVTMYLYQDYTCKGCAFFENGNETVETPIYDKINSEYVQDGELKVVWKNHPGKKGSESYEAALAMECVANESEAAFFVVKDRVLQNYDPSQDIQNRIISESSKHIDSGKVRTCIEDKETKEIVNTDLEEIKMFELATPPAVIIDDGVQKSYWSLDGLRSFEHYSSTIEQAIHSHEKRAS